MRKMEKMMLLVIRFRYGIISDSYWFQSGCRCQDLKIDDREDNYGLHYAMVDKEQSFQLLFI